MHLSLAAKCRLLFGAAVVLIIAAALFVPWRALGYFIQDRNNRRARTHALIARALLDPSDKDWARQQARINQWWENHAAALELPEGQPPRLIRLHTAEWSPLWWEHMLRTTGTVQHVVGPPVRFLIEASDLPPPVRLLGRLMMLPYERREELIAWGKQARVRRALARLAPLATQLDAFQLTCVRMFQGRHPEVRAGSKIPNSAWRIEREPGRPLTYRYILAVRGEEVTDARRPLLGLIDVRLVAADTDATLFWTRVMIVLAGLLAGLLAILVFYLIVQKLILAPVRELTRVAERIAGGDFSARSTIATGDEFEKLAHAFNDMLGQLERARIELETINRSLDTRLGELAQRNVALFEANRLKSEFLANVSHELRTPLTSIIGFADLLRDMTQGPGPVDQVRAARFAHNILTSGRHLLDLINDLLDLAKIEAGRVELHRTRFSLPDICEALSDFMRPLAEKKHQTLTVEIVGDLPMIYSDASKIRQILYNLLSNAVKYTPEGGRIVLRVEPLGPGEVRMSVSDTGPGIPEKDRERIFEKFRQLDGSVTREHSGSGLGLAISRELAILLGGSLRVTSVVGQGSTFIVELPVECPDQVVRPLPSLT